MTIRLEDINEKNWHACASLTLPKEQEKLVAPNVFTLAESKFETHYVVKAIYLNDDLTDEIVGMLAYCREDEDGIENLYWLFRLMIAQPHQGKGYGKQAISLAIAEMNALGANQIRTMHHPDNLSAKHLYKKVGFEEVGILSDGDVLLELFIQTLP